MPAIRTASFIALLGILLGGCDKKAQDTGREVAQEKPLSALFIGKQPTIPAPFKNVTPGMSRDDAEKVLGKPGSLGPGFEVWGDYEGSELLFESREYQGVRRFAVRFDEDHRATALVLNMNAKDGLGALEKAWGPPVVGKVSAFGKVTGKLYFWWNPGKRLRALAEEDETGLTIVLERYFPLEDFLGKERTKFGFESDQAVIGANTTELIETYGSAYVVDPDLEFATLTLPPTDFATMPTKIRVSQDKAGKIWRMFINIDFGAVPSHKKSILERLAAKFGGLENQPGNALDYFETATSPRVIVSAEDTGGASRWFKVVVLAKETPSKSNDGDKGETLGTKQADGAETHRAKKIPAPSKPDDTKPTATEESAAKKPEATPAGLSSCKKMLHPMATKAKLQSASTFEQIPKLVDKEATVPAKEVCKDQKRACGPKAAVSIIQIDDIASEVIVVKRAGADGFWYLARPWDTYLVAVEHRVQKLDNYVHVGVTVPLYERVPFCDDENDPDSCATATADVGEENTDYIIDPKSGEVVWQASCALKEGDESQQVKVALDGDTFSYTACVKGSKPVTFTVAHLATCPSPKENFDRKVRAMINNGRKATKQGKFDEAIGHYDAVLKLQSDSASARAERGYAHLKAGRLNKAREDFDMAIKDAGPKKKKFLGAVWFNLGLVEEKAKNIKAAKEAFKRSVEYRPSKFVQKKLDALKK